jgi:hypothetical protein
MHLDCKKVWGIVKKLKNVYLKILTQVYNYLKCI